MDAGIVLGSLHIDLGHRCIPFNVFLQFFHSAADGAPIVEALSAQYGGIVLHETTEDGKMAGSWRPETRWLEEGDLCEGEIRMYSDRGSGAPLQTVEESDLIWGMCIMWGTSILKKITSALWRKHMETVLQGATIKYPDNGHKILQNCLISLYLSSFESLNFYKFIALEKIEIS